MSQVFANGSAMTEWKNQLLNLNTSCVEDIDKIKDIVSSLNDSFQGSYAEAFENSFVEFTEIVRESHNNMKDFSGFLEQIYEILNNQ